MGNRESPRQLTRRHWFNTGASAVERIWPDLPRCYICPTCGKGFLDTALESRGLTLEHAPSKGIGGREVVLTCRRCNNLAGDKLDDEVKRRENQIDFELNTLQKALPATIDYLGGKLNVLVDNGNVSFAENHNDPKVFSQFVKHRPDKLLNLALSQKYDSRSAFHGYLRSAYLIAFAVLGYRYVFSPRLNVIRQQLANPHETILRVFSATIPNAEKRDRKFFFVDEPAWLKSLVIQMGGT